MGGAHPPVRDQGCPPGTSLKDAKGKGEWLDPVKKGGWWRRVGVPSEVLHNCSGYQRDRQEGRGHY